MLSDLPAQCMKFKEASVGRPELVVGRVVRKNRRAIAQALIASRSR